MNPQANWTVVLNATSAHSPNMTSEYESPFFQICNHDQLTILQLHGKPTSISDKEISVFQKELGKMGYRYQFITLAGFH